MQYRIKVIEYESGHREYVPQVRRKWWNSWKYIDCYGISWHGYDRQYHCFKFMQDACEAIGLYQKTSAQSIIKSVTYKPVQP